LAKFGGNLQPPKTTQTSDIVKRAVTSWEVGMTFADARIEPGKSPFR